MDDKKWQLNRDGVLENVDLERWVWGVVYRDGTELHQFDSEGVFHQFKEIKLDEVTMFCMYKPDDMTKRFDLIVPNGSQLFHFYRNIKPYYLDGFVRAYAFGYKKGDHTSYHFILPDDRVILSDRDDVNLETFDLK